MKIILIFAYACLLAVVVSVAFSEGYAHPDIYRYLIVYPIVWGTSAFLIAVLSHWVRKRVLRKIEGGKFLLGVRKTSFFLLFIAVISVWLVVNQMIHHVKFAALTWAPLILWGTASFSLRNEYLYSRRKISL